MSRQTRKEVKETKKAYRRASREVKAISDKYKRADRTEQRLLKPQTEAEKRYLGQKRKVRKEVADKELAPLRKKRQEAKKAKAQAVARNGGSLPQKTLRSVHHSASGMMESAFRDNDTLDDIVTARQKIRRTHAELRGAKKAGSLTYKVGRAGTKGTYNLANRTYNLTRGRGFTRTPKAQRLETKVKNRFDRIRERLRLNKVKVKTAKFRRVTGKLLKPVTTVLKNPLSLKAYLIVFGGFFIIALLGAIMGGGSSTVAQNEFDLTASWTHLSKLDREKSNDEVDYWTDIDSVMMYMGYRYEDYKLDKPYNLKNKSPYEPSRSYRDLLTTIWEGMNADKDNLKTMADLYKSHKSQYIKLSEKDQKEYEEILEQAQEVGYYINYNELDSPFNNESDDEVVPTVTITKRYGYVSKDELYQGSVLQANKRDTLYAVMAGKVTVTADNDVIIKSKEAEFTYKKVSNPRVKTGDKVSAGSEIGSVASSDGLEVYFKKLKDKKKKEWVFVNVGFYLPKAVYTQTTSVLSDIDMEGDLPSRVVSAYQKLKKLNDKVTLNGVSAMFGNFVTESNLTAKRAEGDYLSPPIGASDASWDDEAWLNIGGPAIYNGRFPNILRRGLGLGQWTDTGDGAVRHTLLRNFAKEKNKKWYDLDLQLEFILNGDNPYYRDIAKSILESNDSVEALTTRFLNRWEGNSGDKLLERQNNAKQVLEILKNPPKTSAVISGDFAHMFNVSYTVVQPYGKTPWSQGGGAWMYPMGRHSGVDLQGAGFETGDVSLFSVTDGTVVSVSPDPMGGYYTIIQPPFGGYLYYGHMKSHNNLSKGQSLKKGDKIGVMGTGGGVYHVHFEYNKDIRTIGQANSQDQDPSQFIQKSGTLTQNQVIIPK
ncbi:phage tail tip lysozyme [Streptococcus sp. zg-JUN1979]|uniref:phage tail tip lysozyme n=1 Tax=Streptococcus sp. zg-JUN1979 TaxID=3391450 RepID=UPI0039A71575